MAPNLGRVVARLAEPSEVLPAEMVDLINHNIKPPIPIEASDVYIRAMYIVSDQVNSFGGRFPKDEHEHLAELLIDSPVLIGHRKDKLPVGRTFHAESVIRDGQPWVKGYFYWLRSTVDSGQLRDNIDGGIYKECSVAFTFGLPECSICGRDIRRCGHEPQEVYEIDGEERRCHFNYRKIERVLETSLVYRGAVPRTMIARELAESSATDAADDGVEPEVINGVDELKEGRRYLLVPAYDGLTGYARYVDDRLTIIGPDNQQLCEFPVGGYRPGLFRPDLPVAGLLLGYRGRARCSRAELGEHLEDKTGPVSRMQFHVFPGQGIVTMARSRGKSQFEVGLIPHRFGQVHDVERLAREIMTRDGVDMWPVPDEEGPFDPLSAPCIRYRPRVRADDSTGCTESSTALKASPDQGTSPRNRQESGQTGRRTLDQNKDDRDYLGRLLEKLETGSMLKADREALRDRLQAIRDRLEAAETLAGEHACLREEYQQRLGGMVKAIAAVDRKRDRWEEAVALIEELPTLPAERLLQTYRRVAARFRDCFPGSFGSYPVSNRGLKQRAAVER
jgi:hypothetical protein